VTVWAHVFLGAIALSTMLMAAIQIGMVVFAARLAKRVDRLADQVEYEVKPILLHLREVASNAQQMSVVAAAQLDRADRLFADLHQRIEQTLAIAQGVLTGPVREGRALLAGLRAGFAAIRELRQGVGRQTSDDEDVLFIG
jgi:hypothetical protein